MSKFTITFRDNKSEEFHTEEKKFLTFEEAFIHANNVRNKLGHNWSTTSIVRDL